MSELTNLTDALTESLRAGVETADQLRAIARRLDLLAQSARMLAATPVPKSSNDPAAAAAAAAIRAGAIRTAGICEQAARQCVQAAPKLERAQLLGNRWIAQAGANPLREYLLAADGVEEAAFRAKDAEPHS
ncbi:hypothetical protein ACFWFQ_00800 [Nocardia salmonicida]|uniref:hypothetical protein n=1 Tax=Nocardia salmonicida TaxID=53431 RepID=UPI003666EE52